MLEELEVVSMGASSLPGQRPSRLDTHSEKKDRSDSRCSSICGTHKVPTPLDCMQLRCGVTFWASSSPRALVNFTFTESHCVLSIAQCSTPDSSKPASACIHGSVNCGSMGLLRTAPCRDACISHFRRPEGVNLACVWVPVPCSLVHGSDGLKR